MSTRVVVLGAGYGGLLVTRALEDRLPETADIHVIDETGEHLIQHELHRVIRRPSLVETLAIPLKRVFERAQIHEATVERVDPGEHRLTFLGDREPLSYDVGVVALGADPDDHDIPGVTEYGTPLKRLHHAQQIREEFLAIADSGARVVVGGGGLAGIQVAGELSALARELEAEVEVALFEQEDAIAPEFPREFQIAVKRELETRGVVVRPKHRISAAGPAAVTVEDVGEEPFDQLVWTGGIRGSAAMEGIRPRVNSTLVHPLDPDSRTFVLGDAAEVIDEDGAAVPASAQAATKAADTVARNVETVVTDDDDTFEPRLERFRFDSSGWLVSIGDGAVAQIGPTVFTGAAAKALKSSVGPRYLASAGAIREAVALAREHYREGEPVGFEGATPESE